MIVSNTLKCPKCGSENIHADKKGFSGTKAVAGAVLAGPVGLLAGTHGSGRIICHCLSCSNKWDNAKHIQEQKQAKQAQDLKNFHEKHADIKLNKNLFYSNYEQGDYEKAKEYLEKFSLKSDDVHSSYKFLKEKDKEFAKDNIVGLLIILGVLIIIGLLLYWIFS